ncbi:MAG: iron uptake porin [Oscillatoria princeps RMCB-10]|nr:iron uptake porin [Oscillatoria princeps RMCB-10]
MATGLNEKVRRAAGLALGWGAAGILIQAVPALAEPAAGLSPAGTVHRSQHWQKKLWRANHHPPIAGAGQARRLSLPEQQSEIPNPAHTEKSPNPPIPAPIQPPDTAEPDSAMAQMTSVEELSDVQPADWAYQALKSLVERYGLRLSYPDGTFRGNQPLTRYEFAAVLAEALEKIPPLIAGDREQFAEDMATLQRLERDFGQALADLSNRLDKITAGTTKLEENRFSATTKMTGQLILTPSTGTAAPIVTRQRLNLLTSWKSEQLLVTQLEMGNGGYDPVSRAQNEGENLLGSAGKLAGAGGLDYVGVGDTVRLSKLQYTFRPLSGLAVTVGAKMSPRDFIDRNRFANDEAVDFNSSFFVSNPLIVQNQIDRLGGAGVAVNWDIKGAPVSLSALYIAADAEDSQKGGFFRDRNQGSLELKFSPDPSWAFRLQYTKAIINDSNISAVGINAEWATNRTTGFFGRFGFGSYDGFNTVLGRDLDAHPWTWAVGVTLRNWAVPGTLAGVAVGQPFVTGDVGDATQTNFEAFYSFLVSDNLSITPSVIAVSHADNDSDNGISWHFAVRSVFSF